jgi:S1-C subfamily serine protease
MPSPNAFAELSDSLAAVVDRTAPAALAVVGRHRRAIATATVWRDGALAITAAHALRHCPATVSLVGEGGRRVDAAVVGSDASTDLALLRLADTAAPAVAAGDTAALRAGHLVIAVGRSGEGDAVASWGLVNRASGPWQTWLGGDIDRLIRLDGGVYEGLSGAPVADASGAVIGLATSALSRSCGIVLPTATVNRVVDQLLAHGPVARGFLGVGAQPAALPDGQAGLLITALMPDGAASRAGLMVGDLIVRIGGAPTGTLQAMRAALAGRAGQTVDVDLVRGGAPTTMPVVVGDGPQRRRC